MIYLFSRGKRNLLLGEKFAYAKSDSNYFELFMKSHRGKQNPKTKIEIKSRFISINWFNDCNHFPSERRHSGLTSFSCLFLRIWSKRNYLSVDKETSWWNYYSDHVPASWPERFDLISGGFPHYRTLSWVWEKKVKYIVSSQKNYAFYWNFNTFM